MRRRSKFPPLLPPLVLSLYLPILPLSLSYYWSLPSLSEFMILEACLSSGRCLAGTGTPPADPLQSSLILASFSLLVAFIFVNFFASPSFTRYYYSIKEVSITRYEEVFRFQASIFLLDLPKIYHQSIKRCRVYIFCTIFLFICIILL